MMDAFTEDEKVCQSIINISILVSIVSSRLAAAANVTPQRFVLAEYIKASQVGTEQLIEFISEPAALNSYTSGCAALLILMIIRSIQLTGRLVFNAIAWR